MVQDLREDLPKPPQPMVVVPVARLDRTAVRALTFASSISDHVRAVHIATSHETAAAFQERWDAWAGKLPLEVLDGMNDQIRRLAAGTPNTAVADVYAHFLGHGASVSEPDRWYWRRSLIEPNAVGAHEMRRLWRDVLDEEELRG